MLFYKKKNNNKNRGFKIFRITLKFVLYFKVFTANEKKKTNKNKKQKTGIDINLFHPTSVNIFYIYVCLFSAEHLQHKVLLLELKIKALVLFD